MRLTCVQLAHSDLFSDFFFRLFVLWDMMISGVGRRLGVSKRIATAMCYHVCWARKDRIRRYFLFEQVDRTRIKLPQRGNGACDDFINASCCVLGQDRYLLAQAPLPNTVEDFWVMVLDQRPRAIVMLTRELEDGRVCVLATLSLANAPTGLVFTAEKREILAGAQKFAQVRRRDGIVLLSVHHRGHSRSQLNSFSRRDPPLRQGRKRATAALAPPSAVSRMARPWRARHHRRDAITVGHGRAIWPARSALARALQVLAVLMLF